MYRAIVLYGGGFVRRRGNIFQEHEGNDRRR